MLGVKVLALAFITALLFSVIVGNLHFGVVHATTDISGVISSDTTWTQAGSPYTLTSNLLVENGVKLTINAGTTVNLGSYYIMVNGTLVARGTSDNPIRFNGGSLTFTSSIAAWNEQTQSGCIIENAILTTTISSENTVKINSNTINNALTVTSDSIVTNNNIKGNVNGGTISGNNITGDVFAQDVFSNYILGNVGGSIVSNNHIKGRVGANGNCVISNNTIIGDTTSDSTGIAVSSAYIGTSGYPKIENNIIANSGIGISVSVLIRSWFSIDIPEIRNNLIIQNGVGIQYSISRQEPWETNQTIIESNTIAKNAIGIKFMGTAQECQIINNNIQENTNYSIYLYQTTDDVNVTNNWWGTTDQSAISTSFYDYYKDFNLGKVNFIPFLTAPNSNAPLISSFVEPSPSPSPSPSPPTPSPETTPTPTPTQEPQQTEQEIIIGVVIAVVVVGAGLGLLIYLIKRK